MLKGFICLFEPKVLHERIYMLSYHLGGDMFLNSSSCLGLFNAYKSDGLKQKDIYSAIFDAIAPNDETDYNPSNIKSGKADIPTSIKAALKESGLRQEQIRRFQKYVIPHIENNLKLLIGSFLLFFEKDKTIADHVSIAGKRKSEWKNYKGVIYPEAFLVGVIAFACLRGARQSNSEEYLTDVFRKRAKSRGNNIILKEETFVSIPTQSITIETANFSAVFHEIPLDIDSNRITLRLFLLDYDCNKFVYDGIINYFKESLFRHAHTLNEINGYKDEGRIASMYSDATSKLRDKYQLIHENVLDMLFVESCISEASQAPKVINILEHDSTGVPAGSHGVHYLKRKINNNTDYQIVVAIAAIQDNDRDALSSIFLDIQKVENADLSWRTKVFSQHALLSRFPPDDARWLADTFVPKNLNQKIPTTRYGIFLGYSVDCTKTSGSLENDITTRVVSLTSDIQEYVSELNLASTEFDIYVVPFNDVTKDKKEIIEGVLP